MNLDVPPRGELPRWGKRADFESFSVELVPEGRRRINVRLSKTFASISFGPDEGRSSLAGDRVRKFDRRPYEYIVTPPRFPLYGESQWAPEVLVFLFEFELVKSSVAAALQVNEEMIEQRVILGAPKPFTTELAQRIRRHMLVHGMSSDYLHSLCFLLLVEMLRIPPQQRQSARGSKLDDAILTMILKYIDANLSEDLTLDKLAELAGVLTHQFARAFKNRVGDSPHHYVLLRRLNAARNLLTGTDHAIADIAYESGFSSQSHLTTSFKREFGVTPAQLRSEESATATN